MLELFLLFFCLSCILGYFTCWLIRKTGPKIGLVDAPGKRKIHSTPMPTGGGIGIWFAVVAPLCVCGLVAIFDKDFIFQKCDQWTIWLNSGRSGLSDSCVEQGTIILNLLKLHLPGIIYQYGRLFRLLALGTVLMILGTLDDRFGLSWKIRLLVQFLVAGLAVYWGWKATFFIGIPWLTAIISVFWIVALINSFNMMDNMDGLSAGVAFICSIFLVVVMFCFTKNPISGEPQLFLGGFLLVLAGAILGFLVHNFPPAKMFMGDGGAYFIGFLLATTTLSATFAGYDPDKRQAIFVPFCILAVPLYDLISVVLIRCWHGKSPFVGDNNHYSHRLVRLGLSKTGAVATIYLTTIICSISSLFLYQVNWISSCLILVQVIMILGLVCILEYFGHKKQ